MATMNTINKVLDTLPDNIRKSNIESLNYIKYLMTATNTSPKRWDIFKIFGGEDDNPQKLVTARNEINKRFMEKLAAQKTKQAEASPDTLKILPQLIEKLQSGLVSSLEGRKADLKYRIQDNTSYIDRLSRDTTTYIRKGANLTRELQQLEGENPMKTIKEDVETVLQGGYWTNPIIYGDFLYLNTQEEIILTQKNKAANIDIEVNVGKLAVKIRMSDLHMRVIPYKNNLSVSCDDRTFYHPHVSHAGTICWGDASPNVSEWMGQMMLGKMLKMLYSLLFTYSDSAPYVTLSSMKNNSRGKGGTTIELRHPERMEAYKAQIKREKEAAKIAAEIQAPAEEVA